MKGLPVSIVVYMTFSGRLPRAALAALFIALSSAGPAVAVETVLAQSASTIKDKVTDTAGVLSVSQKTEISNKVLNLQEKNGSLLYVVFVDGVSSTKQLAQDIVSARGSNTGAMVVDTSGRQLNVAVGADFSGGDEDSLTDAALPFLARDDWAGAADATLDSALNEGSGAGNAGLWLGAGGAAIVVAGGGLWVAARRKTKKDHKAMVEGARGIDPTDTTALNRQSLPVLAELAAQELVATDESIRRGQEELNIAVLEFGAERTRPFTAAMTNAESTLQRAFAIKAQLDADRTIPPGQRRQMLVDIVSSCGQADNELDAQSAEFAAMRNLLLNADSKLGELTQRTVDLRTRLPLAATTLNALRTQYSEQMLASIADNVDMAQVSLTEAEKILDKGRALAAKPAGQQGGLVSVIRDAEHAVEVSNRLLCGIENAASTISTAQSGLTALIEEVEGEIAEARSIEAKGKSQGTDANWAALDQLLERAASTASAARDGAASDPLGHWTQLTSVDTELDAALDTVRTVTKTHAEQLSLFDQQVSVAAASIQAAEDLISSRGQLIGASARTALADAKRLHAQALQLRDTDIRAGLDVARQAADAAQTAQQRAQDDIDDFRRSQQRRQAASSASDIITGMVIGSLLSGGSSHRGYGGGFGGGFGGGGGSRTSSF